LYLLNTQRNLLAKGLINLGNISVGLLLFGQFASKEPFKITTFILGIILFLVFYLSAIMLVKNGDEI